jgi:AcrR family transcriptional regulator
MYYKYNTLSLKWEAQMNQNAIETKRNFLEAFLRIYEKKSVSQITVKEICSVAGYNRSTFYNHFDDIPSILCQIEDQTLARIEQVIRLLSEKEIFQTDAIFVAIKGIYYENTLALSTLLTKTDSHFPQKLRGLMESVLFGFLPDLSNMNSQKLKTAISYHFSAVIGVMAYWLENRDTFEMNLAIDYVREFSKEGILTVIEKML